MATFFGEVLPIRSRAVDDDEEKDIEVDELYFSPRFIKTVDCKLLVCSVGSNASLFTETFLLPPDVKELSHLNTRHNRKLDRDDEQQMLGFNYRKVCAASGALYWHNKTSILYFMCDHILPEQSTSVASMLVDEICQSKPTVLILTTCSASQYVCENLDSLTVPFIRCLISTKYPTGTDDRKPPKKYPNGYLCCPVLEQPNVVSGTAAAILTECEVKSIPSLLLVCFTEQSNNDSDCVKTFLQLLKIASFQNMLKVNCNAEEQLKLRLQAAQDMGNLYT